MPKLQIDLTSDAPIQLRPEEPPKQDDYHRRAADQFYAARRANREARGEDPLSPLERRQHEQAMLAQHSSKSWEHYTPEKLVEPARATMGGIDFDPCSCELAQTVVKATKWIGLPQDGLNVPWVGNCLVNPPGGDTYRVRAELGPISRSYAAIWWGKLMAEYAAGRVTQAIFIVFKLDLLQVTQGMKGIAPCVDYHCCIPDSRVRYDYPLDTLNGYPKPDTTRVESTSPPAASPNTCVGPNTDAFIANFKHLGRIIKSV